MWGFSSDPKTPEEKAAARLASLLSPAIKIKPGNIAFQKVDVPMQDIGMGSSELAQRILKGEAVPKEEIRKTHAQSVPVMMIAIKGVKVDEAMLKFLHLMIEVSVLPVGRALRTDDSIGFIVGGDAVAEINKKTPDECIAMRNGIKQQWKFFQSDAPINVKRINLDPPEQGGGRLR